MMIDKQTVSIRRLDELDVSQKRVLVRVDYNVPIDPQTLEVKDTTRIDASLKTIEMLIERQAKVILMSHLGRPKGAYRKEDSLEPVANILSQRLNRPVIFVPETLSEVVTRSVNQMHSGSVMLLENLRFHAGETANDSDFAKALAELADVYVNDAFGTLHRAHASTAGIASHMSEKGMGLLVQNELAYLGDRLKQPERPFVVLLGGAKVSDKIGVLESLLDKADTVLIGGAMAYTFALAQGRRVGKSLSEPDKVSLAQKILDKAEEKGVRLCLPVDNWATQHLDFAKAEMGPLTCFKHNIEEGFEGVDIGPETLSQYVQEIEKARTLFWNGPMGVFEIEASSHGTFAIADAVAQSKALRLIGGGDSVRAINERGHAKNVDFISTGGGASLAFLEGKALPGLEALAV